MAGIPDLGRTVCRRRHDQSPIDQTSPSCPARVERPPPAVESQISMMQSTDAVTAETPVDEKAAEHGLLMASQRPHALIFGGIPDLDGAVFQCVMPKTPSDENAVEHTQPSWGQPASRQKGQFHPWPQFQVPSDDRSQPAGCRPWFHGSRCHLRVGDAFHVFHEDLWRGIHRRQSTRGMTLALPWFPPTSKSANAGAEI